MAGLAKFLGVTEHRARALLDDPGAYCAEIRRRTPLETQLRRRWHPGCSDPFLP